MCGRFSQTASPEVIAQQFELIDPPLFNPRYNIAPSQPVVAIRIDPDTTTRRLVQLRWGLIPSWAKDPRSGINVSMRRLRRLQRNPRFEPLSKNAAALL